MLIFACGRPTLPLSEKFCLYWSASKRASIEGFVRPGAWRNRFVSEEVAQVTGNPLIVLGDRIARKPHLTSFLENIRTENALLDAHEAVKYAICGDSSEVAITLKKHLDDVKMVLIGPGLTGNGVTVARMLATKAHIVMVIDPAINPLAPDPENYKTLQRNLEELGVILVLANDATESFYEPLIKEYVLSEYVLSGLPVGSDLSEMTPEERAQMIDKRLEAVNSFPSLPDTQRKVSDLDDLDPPKKWAEAIDPDLPTKTVILKILNSARYGFRSRVETIDQAVALASAKTIREIVTACQIRAIFQNTSETTIDQFWRHSLAVGFLSKLFSLPANPSAQSTQQKTEFERFQLEEEQVAPLQEFKLWEKIELGENDDAFTAGLLHDMGKVTMLMCLEDSLELILALIEQEVQEEQEAGNMWAKNAIEIERLLMKDIDHQVIGGRLAEKWEVDESIRTVITRHHVQEHSPGIIKFVGLANAAANCLYPYPATETQHPFPLLFITRQEVTTKSRSTRPVSSNSSDSPTPRPIACIPIPHRNAASVPAALRTHRQSRQEVDEAGCTTEAVEEAINEEIFEDLVDVISRLAFPTTFGSSSTSKSPSSSWRTSWPRK